MRKSTLPRIALFIQIIAVYAGSISLADSIPECPAPRVVSSAMAKFFCSPFSTSWKGTGVVRNVDPGMTQTQIQAVLDGSSNGDTVLFAEGTYVGVSLTVNKSIRLKAPYVYGAQFWGKLVPPRFADDRSTGQPIERAIWVKADGVSVEGFDFRYYGIGVHVSNASDVVVHGNRFSSNYADGIILWDTKNSEVRCNELRDPYLVEDSSATLTKGNSTKAQMDYGIDVGGSINPLVHHNYLFGVFNQAMSFKEGNCNAYAGYNTFEGFQYTALFFGQNSPHNLFLNTGLNALPDRGEMIAEYNVFRPVYSMRGSNPVYYFANTAIRPWHIDGTIKIQNNIIEASQIGIMFETKKNPITKNCEFSKGNAIVSGNLIAGAVSNPATKQIVQVGLYGGMYFKSGSQLNIVADRNTVAFVSQGMNLVQGDCSGAVTPTITNSIFYKMNYLINFGFPSNPVKFNNLFGEVSVMKYPFTAVSDFGVASGDTAEGKTSLYFDSIPSVVTLKTPRKIFRVDRYYLGQFSRAFYKTGKGAGL